MFIFILQLVQAYNQCECNQITKTADCVQLGCKWDGLQCSEFQCKEITIPRLCDNISNCSWNNGKNLCAPFTKCSDYKVTNPGDCYNKGNKTYCKPPSSYDENDGLWHCEEIKEYSLLQKDYVECLSFLTQGDCHGIQKDLKSCYWKTSQYPYVCAPLGKTSCNDADGFDKSVCDLSRCTWNGEPITEQSKIKLEKQSSGQILIEQGNRIDTCNPKQCSDFKIPEQCLYIRSFDDQSFTLCQWQENQCQTNQNADFLKQQDCLSLSMKTHFWNGINCQSCSGTIRLVFYLVFLILIYI